MKENLLLDTSFRLIQQIRLVHALAESSYRISVPVAEQSKFEALRESFSLQLSVPDANSVDITGHVQVSHREPMTAIGAVARCLIIPHGIAGYCRSLWPSRRDVRFAFQGLLTGQRKILIEDWAMKNITGREIRLPRRDGFAHAVRKRVLNAIGLDQAVRRTIGDLCLVFSDRGREFPAKAWDEEYFRTLARSQFVLCPSGDCVWSYRFFESMLCGAIPIVERSCPAYDGFHFASLEDAASDLHWSAEVAEHNYGVCLEKLTVKRALLDDALHKAMESAG